MKALNWLALLAVLVAPATATGQELARRVSQVDDGTVRFNYPTRPEVEICDQGIRMGDDRIRWHSGDWDDGMGNCREGPAEVEVSLRGGAVRDVEVIRRQRNRTDGAIDLGAVTAQEAVDFFLETARNGGRSGRGEEDALFPAVLADVDEIWRDLMVMAKDRGVDGDIRSSALFWVGQEAASVVTEGLADVALDEEEDQDVREAAVFALSQRPSEEGVPILMEVARTAREKETRQSAMFWLAQSEDERVYAFFEEILLRRGGL
jgi:HEAT repeats